MMRPLYGVPAGELVPIRAAENICIALRTAEGAARTLGDLLRSVGHPADEADALLAHLQGLARRAADLEAAMHPASRDAGRKRLEERRANELRELEREWSEWLIAQAKMTPGLPIDREKHDAILDARRAAFHAATAERLADFDRRFPEGARR